MRQYGVVIFITGRFAYLLSLLWGHFADSFHFDVYCDDIGVLDLRVCYNGEWYTFEKLSDEAINEIRQHPAIPAQIKEDINDIIRTKQEIHFYDVYLIAFDPITKPISSEKLSPQV